MTQTVLIIGAGQAGLQTATSLRLGGFEGEIVMVGSEEHPPYQRPPLSKQVLKGEWAAERCQLRKPEFFNEHGITLLTGRTATALDTAGTRVQLDDGESLSYDWLVIATGGNLRRLSLPGTGLTGLHYLRSMDDTVALRAALQPGSRLAVIGGGYIGLEVAASARKLGCEVTVVEALDALMKRSALPEIADFLHRRHREEGVTIHLGAGVAGFSGEERLDGLLLDDGRRMEADAALVGIGVDPAVDWLASSPLECGRGVLVDRRCATNVDNIFAAGDVAEQREPLYPGGAVLESVQNAVGQGRVVAAAILGEDADYSEIPWFWSEQYDCRLQMAGIPTADEERITRGDPASGAFCLFGVLEGALRSVQCINMPKEFMACRQLIAAGSAVEAAQLADKDFNLKELL